MYLDVVRPAHNGAGHLVQTRTHPEPDAFERLPVNLSADEIRAMVLEVIG